MRRPTDLQALIDELSVLHARLGAQIEVLRQPSTGRDHELLLQYVVMQSASDVADWANDVGWRMQGRRGERRYTKADVLALLDAPGVQAPEPLREVARQVRDENWRILQRQFG